MGSCYSQPKKYNHFINDSIENNENDYNNKILVLTQYIEQLENKQKIMDKKLIELQNQNGRLEQKLNIMASDLESLLNNDKLLLEKMIEKNILSTINN